ncbi:MAG: hypothetical protein JWN73_3606 [Betaproteobacteria bacterium]|nr:hypothetical protein [Betaproteobacteria bacterium]
MPELLDATPAARAITQALLVGGPLHGKLLPLSAERAVTLMPEHEGEQYLYVRRTGGNANANAETAVFVFGGKPTPAQVQDAVDRAPLTRTAKMRVLSAAP